MEDLLLAPSKGTAHSDEVDQRDRKGLRMLMITHAAIIVISLFFAALLPIAGGAPYLWLIPVFLNLVLCGCARATRFLLPRGVLLFAWSSLFLLVAIGSIANLVWDIGGPIASAVCFPLTMMMLLFPSMLGESRVTEALEGPRSTREGTSPGRR